MGAVIARDGVERHYGIPPLIRRNTLLVAGAQMCVGAGLGVIPTLGALMVVRLLGSPAYAGLALGTLGVSRFLVAYRVGVLADRLGRRPTFAIALAVAVAGALGAGWGMAAGSFPLFMVGVLVFGLGVGAGLQLRVAATDMFPRERRAEGLGYVATGSVVGAVLSAAVVALADATGSALGLDALTLVWWLTPLVLLPGMLLILRVRPDPMRIAAHLDWYYPEYLPDPEPLPNGEPRSNGDFRTMVRHFPKLAAFVASFVAQGNMSMVMAVTAVALAHRGHGLTAIGVASAIHAVGMFAFGIPQGWLADRLGRRPLILAGLLIAALGSVTTAMSDLYWMVAVGFFLVGFGWSCVNVAATAFVADICGPEERGRAIGAIDTFSGAGNILLALGAGPLVDSFGMPALGLVGPALVVGPALMMLRVREARPLPPGHA